MILFLLFSFVSALWQKLNRHSGVKNPLLHFALGSFADSFLLLSKKRLLMSGKNKLVGSLSLSLSLCLSLSLSPSLSLCLSLISFGFFSGKVAYIRTGNESPTWNNSSNNNHNMEKEFGNIIHCDITTNTIYIFQKLYVSVYKCVQKLAVFCKREKFNEWNIDFLKNSTLGI